MSSNTPDSPSKTYRYATLEEATHVVTFRHPNSHDPTGFGYASLEDTNALPKRTVAARAIKCALDFNPHVEDPPVDGHPPCEVVRFDAPDDRWVFDAGELSNADLEPDDE